MFIITEGSASIDIEDREKLAATQKVGKGMSIICDVQLTNVSQASESRRHFRLPLYEQNYGIFLRVSRRFLNVF